MAFEVEVVSSLGERGTSVMNTTEIATGDLARDPQIREIANRMSRWIDNARSASGRTSMLDRGMFIPPENPYDEMRTARNAVRYDSVVAGIGDLTESIAFDHMKWESPDPDEADIFNQLAGDQNLDAVIRAMWKEEYCVDDQTEVLTRRGWMTHDRVYEDDQIWALDPETNAASWQPLQAITRYDWDGPLVHLHTNRISALVTPNHRWLTEHRNGQRRFMTTDELRAAKSNTSLSLVVAGGDSVGAFAKQAELSDELVELIGWVVTEGHYQVHESKCLNGIIVAQSRTANLLFVERIRRLQAYFTATGATFSEYRSTNGDISHFYLGTGVAEVVRALAPDRQLLPSLLTLLTHDQAQLLYDTLLAGDGTYTRCDSSGYSESWTQKDRGRIAGFQMLCAMLGRRTRYIVDAHIPRVTIYKAAYAALKNIKFGEQQYKGVVWCPTTPSHTWFARRDGNTFWTGNTYNAFVCAGLWGSREYIVRGQTKNGNARKKKMRIWAPLQLRLLDPLKVVPVGVGPLGGERLAWQATLGEIGYYQSVYGGETIDPLMLAFFDGTYIPSVWESAQLSQIKVDPTRLLVMNQDLVWRHTTTKPDYERFPDVSMKAIFALLDLKRQLMNSDRAILIGSANYILLIKKGDEKRPAQPDELRNLRENYNFIAKMPVIISDDRLNIEIIAPKTDFVLQQDKYDNLDHRILQRLLGTMSISGRGQRNETQETISYVVARNMENRRHMLKRALEEHIARAVVQHPKNAGLFNYEPNLVYTPRNLSLSMQPAYIQGLQALRTQREISRETILEFFGLDEETEAMRVQIEAERFDDIFKTEIPYTGGAPGEGPDPSLDKKDASGSGALVVSVGPDGTLTAAPPAKAAPAKKTAAPAKTATTKDGPNKGGAKSAPASGQPSTGRKKTGPNGTPEAPGVAGARGGRPVGGGVSSKSPAATAKPRTPRGNPKTKASDEGPASD